MIRIVLTKTITFAILYFFVINCRAQTFDWARQLGGNNTDQCNAITLDKWGNIYTTGAFIGIADFDPGPGVFNLTGVGFDVFICKYNPSGGLVWAKSIGSNGSDVSVTISVSDSENVYVSGSFENTVDFDPGPGLFNLSGGGSFLCKLDSAGDFVWARRFYSSYGLYNYSTHVDKTENIFMAGWFNGIADMDPDTGIVYLNSYSGNTMFINQFDAGGNLVMTKQLGSKPTKIITDARKNIYVAGTISDTVDFDPGIGVHKLVSKGLADGFVCKLDSSGNLLWVKQLGGNYIDLITSMVIDSMENIYIAGEFEDQIDVDPNAGVLNFTSKGNSDIFLVKLDSAGDFKWAHQYGASIGEGGPRLVLDKNANIFLKGMFEGDTDFDPGLALYSLYGTHPYNMFIIKFNPLGNMMWVRQTVGDGSNNNMVVGTDDNIYLSGDFAGTVDFDPGNGFFYMTQNGVNTDVFLLKLIQDSCSAITLLVDSVSDIKCSASGYAGVIASGGMLPDNFAWNTNPTTNNPMCYFDSVGLYTLTYTDANGCSQQRTLLVNGPDMLNDFDLSGNIITPGFRPGFQSKIQLDVFNKGCANTINGNVQLVLDSKLVYDQAVPVPDNINGDTLSWNFSNLIFDSTHFVPVVYVTTPITAQIGDSVYLELVTNPIQGDVDTSDNQKKYFYIVRGSFDPNDKQVYPVGYCHEGYVLNDQELTYTIRFQNTGTYEAINVFILDSLDTNLNVNTLRIRGSSHAMITELLPDNKLKFRFDNIFLVSKSQYEPASHGYVTYSVKPVMGIAENTPVVNIAGIYFDFNAPVITNAVENKLVSVIPVCDPAFMFDQVDLLFKYFPNPVNDYLVLSFDDIISHVNVSINNTIGEKVFDSDSYYSSRIELDVRLLVPGVYFMEVRVGDKVVNKKVIIQ